jgi:hypothetical protein
MKVNFVIEKKDIDVSLAAGESNKLETKVNEDKKKANDDFAKIIAERKKLNLDYWEALGQSYGLYKRDPEMARMEGLAGAHTTKSAMEATLYSGPVNKPKGSLEAYEAQRELDHAIEKAILTEQVFDNLYESISSGMTDAIFDWADGVASAEDAFRQFAASFLREMARMITQQLIFNSISSIFGGGSYGSSVNLTSVIGGLFGAAEGGITKGSFTPITAFASGGIATRPTMGMVAEAGESEAIIPLSKLPQVVGSLAGGETNFYLTVNNSGAGQMSDQQSAQLYSQVKKDMNNLFSKSLAEKQRPGGQLNRYESRMN